VHPLEKPLQLFAITGVVVAGVEQLEPENVVSDSPQAERKLQKPCTMSARLIGDVIAGV
jgi:hypothetical protein